ncbi:CCA tRNA nucleotidyltransferase [Propionicicella superfundia]|uniref:CCA tRNA nucleotidyltransferase n=1 Tax=Propionicicella superfundia TaxID=348582 RepID=UPI00042698B9|nr:CCA tRNA nucleotidyltransferase [Propionicicella superfundia]
MPGLTREHADALRELVTSNPVLPRLATAFAGAKHDLYLVGGSVRDALLGRLGSDLDFATDARPDDIERCLRTLTPATWDMGREFGTIGAQVSAGGQEWTVEVTTYRADSYHPETRKPTVAFGDNLRDDLARRDFAMNAMAVHLVDRTFHDPFGGLTDLAQHTIRTPGSAELSFSDDPLRMMRGARFVAQLGFELDADAEDAMRSMADRISIVSAERVRDELVKLLSADRPRAGLNALVRTGLSDHVLPELPAMKLQRDEHHRHKDVYEHSLTVLDQAIALEWRLPSSPDIVNRLAALLHDIGKPATRRFEGGGKVSFHHHEIVGAKLARKRLQALRFPTDQVKAVTKLIELHLRFHGYGEQEWTDAAVRRYVRDAGDQLERLHILTRADCTTRNVRKAQRLARAYEELEVRIDQLAAQEELDALRPDLDGDEIMAALGISPGPVVGRAYAFLLERRIEDGPLGVDAARAALLEWWAGQPESARGDDDAAGTR